MNGILIVTAISIPFLFILMLITLKSIVIISSFHVIIITYMVPYVNLKNLFFQKSYFIIKYVVDSSCCHLHNRRFFLLPHLLLFLLELENDSLIRDVIARIDKKIIVPVFLCLDVEICRTLFINKIVFLC